METKTAVKALGALAQESRLAAFRLLVEAGLEGLPAGEISARLRMPPATASFHLAQLSNAGLLKSRTEGRFVIYAVDFGRISSLVAFLTENCCGGNVCSPLARAIRKPKRGKT